MLNENKYVIIGIIVTKSVSAVEWLRLSLDAAHLVQIPATRKSFYN